MSNIKDIIICIPIFNEKQNIKNVVSVANKYGSIVIVDDNSTDNFQKELKNYNLKIIHNSINLGYEKSIIKVPIKILSKKNSAGFCLFIPIPPTLPAK